MTKLIVASVGVFALVLFCPGTSHAGGLGNRTVSLEVTNEPVSVEPNEATVDCTTLTDCTWISSIPEQGNHNPAMQFMVGADQNVHVTAGIWLTLGCPGDPDAIAMGPADGIPLMAGLNTIRIVFTPPLDDGTPLALEWIIGNCPITACGNFASLGCEPPPFCNPPAP